MKKKASYAFYNEISLSLSNSTTAAALPFTPNFCMTFDIWFLTVFSLIPKDLAMSIVDLFKTSKSNQRLVFLFL